MEINLFGWTLSLRRQATPEPALLVAAIYDADIRGAQARALLPITYKENDALERLRDRDFVKFLEDGARRTFVRDLGADPDNCSVRFAGLHFDDLSLSDV